MIVKYSLIRESSHNLRLQLYTWLQGVRHRCWPLLRLAASPRSDTYGRSQRPLSHPDPAAGPRL